MLAQASVMKREGRAHTWRFLGHALHSLHFSGPEGADSVHPSRRGRRLGGGGVEWW